MHHQNVISFMHIWSFEDLVVSVLGVLIWCMDILHTPNYLNMYFISPHKTKLKKKDATLVGCNHVNVQNPMAKECLIQNISMTEYKLLEITSASPNLSLLQCDFEGKYHFISI